MRAQTSCRKCSPALARVRALLLHSPPAHLRPRPLHHQPPLHLHRRPLPPFRFRRTPPRVRPRMPLPLHPARRWQIRPLLPLLPRHLLLVLPLPLALRRTLLPLPPPTLRVWRRAVRVSSRCPSSRRGASPTALRDRRPSHPALALAMAMALALALALALARLRPLLSISRP